MQAKSHGSGYVEVWQYPIDSDVQVSTEHAASQVRIVTANARQLVTLQERTAIGQLDSAWRKLSSSATSRLDSERRRSSSNLEQRFSDLSQDGHGTSHSTTSGELRTVAPSPASAKEELMLVFENQSRSTPLSSFKPAKNSGPLSNSPWTLASGEEYADVRRAQFTSRRKSTAQFRRTHQRAGRGL